MIAQHFQQRFQKTIPAAQQQFSVRGSISVTLRLRTHAA
jgi:hypothetical protein